MALTARGNLGLETIEALLRDDLQHADQAMIHMGPILRHLLQNDDSSIFNDEVVARVRGMLADLARQLVQALGESAGHQDAAAWAREAGPGLSDMLGANQALLAHLHMLAIEWQLCERMQGRLGIDPVLTPLLQDIIAAADPDLAARGMNLLAAQARFGQSIRRMQLPLLELPGDLHHLALVTMQGYVADDPAGVSAAQDAERLLRQSRARHESRLELLAHSVGALGGEKIRTLDLQHAGVALFLTGLAISAKLTREMAVMCTTESQMPRLALSLAASGLGREGIAMTFAALHPDIALPDGLEMLGADRAAGILEMSERSGN